MSVNYLYLEISSTTEMGQNTIYQKNKKHTEYDKVTEEFQNDFTNNKCKSNSIKPAEGTQTSSKWKQLQKINQSQVPGKLIKLI